MPQHHDEPMTLEEYHELAAQARVNLAKPVGSRPTPDDRGKRPEAPPVHGVRPLRRSPIVRKAAA